MLQRPNPLLLAICLVLGIALFVSVVAPFQPPQHEQQQTYAKQKAETKPAEHKPTKSLWERTHEDAVAFYTFVLSCFTGLLVIVTATQIGFLIRADKTARIAAEAADRSARAAIGIQLPIIRIRPDDLGHGDSVVGGEPYEECTVHSVVLSNLGATKAFPTEILYGWTMGEVLPGKPSYRASDKFLPNIILDPDPKVTPRKTLTLGMPLKPGEWSKICGGNYLWFYCTLLYDDFMETRREAAFCWRWAYVGSGVAWRPDNTPAYNRKGEYPPI